MVILNGLKNFLQFVNDNWAMIVAVAALAAAACAKALSFAKMTGEERLEIAKAQIRDSVLKWITDAEVGYSEWAKAGSIKRSEVIARIFEEYPILSRFADQDSLVGWIDGVIDDALEELRRIVEANGGIPEKGGKHPSGGPGGSAESAGGTPEDAGEASEGAGGAPEGGAA